MKPDDLDKPRRSILRYLILVSLLQRLVLLLVGLIVIKWFSGTDLPWSFQILDLWNQWDSAHYLTIAQAGYSGEGDAISLLAFMPAYPVAVKLVSMILPNYIVAGILVSWVGQVLSGFFLWELVRRKWGETIARRIVLYLYLFPTAYFFTVPYSESLFLMFILASFYFAQAKRWVWVGVCAMFATGTRLTGLALIAGLLVEARYQGRDRRFWLRAFLASIGLAGFVVYLFVNWQVGGNPFAFLQVQEEYWKVGITYPGFPIREAITGITQGGLERDYIFVYWGTLIAALLGGGLLLAGIRKVRPSHQVYAWGGLLIPLCTSWLVSLPRFILLLFPLFVVLGTIRLPGKVHGFILGFFFAAQVAFFALYALGWWTF